MSVLGHDFTGYRVVVTGGARGAGLAIAHAFADAGASVTVTGTMILPSLYDGDLSRFDYEQLNLARQHSIDDFVAGQGEVDVLVNAAGASISMGMDATEQEFIRQAVSLGMLGPAFLMTRLRMRLAQSPAPGGGVVINTAAVLRWQALASGGDLAVSSLAEDTRRAAESWSRIGSRVNSVVEPAPSWIPRQHNLRAQAGSMGDVMVREYQETHQALASAVLFLAGAQAARITGQTLFLS